MDILASAKASAVQHAIAIPPAMAAVAMRAAVPEVEFTPARGMAHPARDSISFSRVLRL